MQKLLPVMLFVVAMLLAGCGCANETPAEPAHWKLLLFASVLGTLFYITRQEPIEVPELWPCVVSG
jgi:hypothetical protein